MSLDSDTAAEVLAEDVWIIRGFVSERPLSEGISSVLWLTHFPALSVIAERPWLQNFGRLFSQAGT